MAQTHGKDTVIILDGKDLSGFGTQVTWEKTPDIHDTTTFGKSAHLKQGGLLDGKAGLEGIYDNTVVTGPRAVLNPIVGQTKTLIFRGEGTGAGKPQDSVSVVVGKYVQTHPVADMVKWAVDLEFSDVVTSTTQ